MNVTHKSMMALTADMPMKEFVINRDVYLQRYFAHTLADGTQVWYHRFLGNDSERDLHSHPWQSRSTILVGRYTEHLRLFGKSRYTEYRVGDINFIRNETLHRIIDVEPNTWTMMMVSPGWKDNCEFIDDKGHKIEMYTSLFEWHKYCKPRADT